MTAALLTAALISGQQYLPMIQVMPHQWPQAGVSVPWRNRASLDALLIDGAPIWYYDWWSNCSLYADQWYGGAYVPMIYREWNNFVLRCNDGRPLLVGNEPELASQSNLTPTEMATLLHTAVGSAWAGPIYCCGIMVQHIGYMGQVIAEYRRMFGEWPVNTGVHFHLYVVGPDGSPVVTSVGDDDVMRAQAAFDGFMALLAANGLLTRRVVVSECCVLSNVLTQAEVLSAASRLVNHAMSNPNVATVAWFSVYSVGGGASEFTSSDLVTGNQVNGLGQAWLDYAAGRVLRGD